MVRTSQSIFSSPYQFQASEHGSGILLGYYKSKSAELIFLKNMRLPKGN